MPATLQTMTPARDQKLTQSVRLYGHRLLGYIRSRVRSAEDAEDILQDVWYQLARLADLDQIGQLGAWLFRVAERKIIDRSRKQRATTSADFSFFVDELDEPIEAILFTTDETPESQTLRKLFWEELYRALNELPPEQRHVFIQNELEGMTFRELATQSGENMKTLISRKQYAVRKLRDRLQTLHEQLP